MSIFHAPSIGNETVLPSYKAQPCNCVGPQNGERLCPCALRVEAMRNAQMLREGIVINGQRYRLVKDEAP